MLISLPNGFRTMSNLILNSFPVEVYPTKLLLPSVEFKSWEASTAEKNKKYSKFLTHRHSRALTSDQQTIRLVLLSGPAPPAEIRNEEIDIGDEPKVARVLIENALSSHLGLQGMIIKKGRFEFVALRRVEASTGRLIHLHSGISFSARRPFRAQPHSFVLSAQWVARAVFSETLANTTLQGIARGLGVLYVPKIPPPEDLVQYQNHFIGHVRQVTPPEHAEVICRDDVRRSIPLDDLTLEGSPEALRRYEQLTGSPQQPSRIWRRLQQLSKVLTNEGRRNPSVLRDRLDAIRGVLGGFSKEQLVLPLNSYVEGTVSIGLAPIRVEISS
jgi:hypothetical protein